MNEHREVCLDVPQWARAHGTPVEWYDTAALWARIENAVAVIEGNAAGLRSLARLLLTLAAPAVPMGTHVHLFEQTGLQRGPAELIIERLERSPAEDRDAAG